MFYESINSSEIVVDLFVFTARNPLLDPLSQTPNRGMSRNVLPKRLRQLGFEREPATQRILRSAVSRMDEHDKDKRFSVFLSRFRDKHLH